MNKVNKRSRDIRLDVRDLVDDVDWQRFEIESSEDLSSLGDRPRLDQGNGSEMALNFRRPFVGANECVTVMDCLRSGSSLT